MSYLVEVHDEGVGVAGAHVEDVGLAGLHLGGSPVQEAEYRQLACVFVLAQQREGRAALAAPAPAAALQLLKLPVPAHAAACYQSMCGKTLKCHLHFFHLPVWEIIG